LNQYGLLKTLRVTHHGTYGASGNGNMVMAEYGFTTEKVVAAYQAKFAK
jgi:transketolase